MIRVTRLCKPHSAATRRTPRLRRADPLEARSRPAERLAVVRVGTLRLPSGVTTPLVDLASPATRWACWPGHFGEGRYGFEVSTPTADWFTTTVNKYVNVAGPRSPLWQAENGSVNHYGVCDRGAKAAETDALQSPLAALLARQPAG